MNCSVHGQYRWSQFLLDYWLHSLSPWLTPRRNSWKCKGGRIHQYWFNNYILIDIRDASSSRLSGCWNTPLQEGVVCTTHESSLLFTRAYSIYTYLSLIDTDYLINFYSLIFTLRNYLRWPHTATSSCMHIKFNNSSHSAPNQALLNYY
jgi:hypothetical protein